MPHPQSQPGLGTEDPVWDALGIPEGTQRTVCCLLPQLLGTRNYFVLSQISLYPWGAELPYSLCSLPMSRASARTLLGVVGVLGRRPVVSHPHGVGPLLALTAAPGGAGPSIVD